MMTMYNMLCLVVLVVQVQGLHDISNLCHPRILWQEGCDQYTITQRVAPGVDHIDYRPSIPLSECRSWCTGERECGGFRWRNYTSPGGITSCLLYNINDNILNEQFSGLDMYYSEDWYTWGSKTCPYETGASDLTCNTYSNTVPVNTYIKYPFTSMWTTTPNLTAAKCHSWCTLYTECKSVSHYTFNPNGLGGCYLHEYTVEELQAAGEDDHVEVYTGTERTWTNYVRFCGDGSPYTPTVGCQAATTTTQAAPTPSGGIQLIPSVNEIVSGLTVIMINYYVFVETILK